MFTKLCRELVFSEWSKFSCLRENNHRDKSYSECKRRGEQIVKLIKALFTSVSVLLCYKTNEFLITYLCIIMLL